MDNQSENKSRLLPEKTVDKILHFWFGNIKRGEIPDDEHRKRWWVKDAETDLRIKDMFLDDLRSVKAHGVDDLTLSPRESLALIILLDQFSRNIYRDRPEAFSGDAAALSIALKGIDDGLDESLHPMERIFYYMPLMHSENLEIQKLSLKSFRRLEEQYPAPPELHEKLRGSAEYAEKHARIIEHFGRYPHRNEILGRESTDEEKEFLKEPGSSF